MAVCPNPVRVIVEPTWSTGSSALHSTPPALSCYFVSGCGPLSAGLPLTVEGSGVQWGAVVGLGGPAGPGGRAGGGSRVSRHPYAPTRRQGPVDPPREVPGRVGGRCRDHQRTGALSVRVSGARVPADRGSASRDSDDPQGSPGIQPGVLR